MSKVRKSIFLSFGQNYFNFVLQFVSSIIIARLLTPAEIGVFSVSMVIIGFAHRLRDFGAASYVIQEKDLTTEKIRSAFAMTIITAWIMAAAIGFGSSYAAEFYREPGVKSVMLVLCLNFILLPFGVIPMAYMQRQMNFRHVTTINILSNIGSSITTIGLAYGGFSYLALAWGSVVGIICNIVLATYLRPAGLPMLPGIKEIRKVFSFGSLSSLVMILNDIANGIPDLLLGRISGMAVVGYFGRAMGLVSMFDRFVMSGLWSVVLPHFAEQSRNAVSVKESFHRSMSYATALAWPFFICLALFARPVILVLYGAKWEPSVQLLQLLCIAMAIVSPFLLLGSMMTAIGQMKQNFYLLAAFVPIRILSVFVAAPYGLSAVGAAFVVSNVICAILSYFQCKTVLGSNLRDFIRSLRESAGITLSTIIPALIVLLPPNGIFVENPWLNLLIGMVSCALGWLGGIFIFKHPLKMEITNTFLMMMRFASFSK